MECDGMSVIIELAIFPMDKGESVSPYVARVLDLIKNSGLPFQLNPMGTCIEGQWEEVMALVNQCFQALQKDSNRIYMTLKADYRKNTSGRIQGKVASVQGKMK